MPISDSPTDKIGKNIETTMEPPKPTLSASQNQPSVAKDIADDKTARDQVKKTVSGLEEIVRPADQLANELAKRRAVLSSDDDEFDENISDDFDPEPLSASPPTVAASAPAGEKEGKAAKESTGLGSMVNRLGAGVAALLAGKISSPKSTTDNDEFDDFEPEKQTETVAPQAAAESESKEKADVEAKIKASAERKKNFEARQKEFEKNFNALNRSGNSAPPTSTKDKQSSENKKMADDLPTVDPNISTPTIDSGTIPSSAGIPPAPPFDSGTIPSSADIPPPPPSTSGDFLSTPAKSDPISSARGPDNNITGVASTITSLEYRKALADFLGENIFSDAKKLGEYYSDVVAYKRDLLYKIMALPSDIQKEYAEAINALPAKASWEEAYKVHAECYQKILAKAKAIPLPPDLATSSPAAEKIGVEEGPASPASPLDSIDSLKTTNELKTMAEPALAPFQWPIPPAVVPAQNAEPNPSGMQMPLKVAAASASAYNFPPPPVATRESVEKFIEVLKGPEGPMLAKELTEKKQLIDDLIHSTSGSSRAPVSRAQAISLLDGITNALPLASAQRKEMLDVKGRHARLDDSSVIAEIREIFRDLRAAAPTPPPLAPAPVAPVAPVAPLVAPIPSTPTPNSIGGIAPVRAIPLSTPLTPAPPLVTPAPSTPTSNPVGSAVPVGATPLSTPQPSRSSVASDLFSGMVNTTFNQGFFLDQIEKVRAENRESNKFINQHRDIKGLVASIMSSDKKVLEEYSRHLPADMRSRFENDIKMAVFGAVRGGANEEQQERDRIYRVDRVFSHNNKLLEIGNKARAALVFLQENEGLMTKISSGTATRKEVEEVLGNLVRILPEGDKLKGAVAAMARVPANQEAQVQQFAKQVLANFKSAHLELKQREEKKLTEEKKVKDEKDAEIEKKREEAARLAREKSNPPSGTPSLAALLGQVTANYSAKTLSDTPPPPLLTTARDRYQQSVFASGSQPHMSSPTPITPEVWKRVKDNFPHRENVQGYPDKIRIGTPQKTTLVERDAMQGLKMTPLDPNSKAHLEDMANNYVKIHQSGVLGKANCHLNRCTKEQALVIIPKLMDAGIIPIISDNLKKEIAADKNPICQKINKSYADFDAAKIQKPQDPQIVAPNPSGPRPR